MDMLWYGLKVALIGMGVVFVGLIILIGCIKALKGARPAQMNESPETEQSVAPPAAPLRHPPAAPPVPQAPRTYVPGPPLGRDSDALYAVLTAAVAATLETEGRNPEGGFAIRSVRTLAEVANGPKLTRKDDALYAVLAAAIAATLEAEGRNPEGGFAIRSVTPVHA